MRRLTCILACTCLLQAGSSAQLTNGGASMVVGSGAYIVLDNLAFINNGTFNQTAGTVTFSGNVNTFIAGASTPVFYTISLNKPGATLQLQTGIAINNQLQFTSGLVDLNNNTISLNTAASLVGESETSRVAGASGGYVEISSPLNAPVAVNPGNLGAVISASTNLGTVRIRRGQQAQTNGTKNSILRYYDITPANNSSLNATLRFNYFNAETNGLNKDLLTVWKSADNITWTDQDFTSYNTAGNYVELAGIGSFSRSTLFTTGHILPYVKIYPNPAQPDCQVKIESATNDMISMRLYDSKGALLLQSQATILIGKNSIPLRLYHFSSGIYSLVISWKDGKTKTFKVEKL